MRRLVTGVLLGYVIGAVKDNVRRKKKKNSFVEFYNHPENYTIVAEVIDDDIVIRVSPKAKES